MTETWKLIPGFPGYEVSDQGQVRSYFEMRPGGWQIAATPQRIMKPSGVYPGLCLMRDGIAHRKHIAALVMLAFEGECPEGAEVKHIDNDPANNRLTNLCYRHGYGRARMFSSEEAIEIRKRRNNGASTEELAEAYGCCAGTIYNLCNGTTYAEVGGPVIHWHRSREEVVSMRQARANGVPIAKLSEQYGISESAVSLICAGKRYKDVGGPRTVGTVKRTMTYLASVLNTSDNFHGERITRELLEDLAYKANQEENMPPVFIGFAGKPVGHAEQFATKEDELRCILKLQEDASFYVHIGFVPVVGYMYDDERTWMRLMSIGLTNKPETVGTWIRELDDE